MRLTVDIQTLLAAGLALAGIAGAWANSEARDASQDKALSVLERALERERAERLAALERYERLASQSVVDRALWMASGRRAREERRAGE